MTIKELLKEIENNIADIPNRVSSDLRVYIIVDGKRYEIDKIDLENRKYTELLIYGKEE